jgi:hypothetical protein
LKGWDLIWRISSNISIFSSFVCLIEGFFFWRCLFLGFAAIDYCCIFSQKSSLLGTLILFGLIFSNDTLISSRFLILCLTLCISNSGWIIMDKFINEVEFLCLVYSILSCDLKVEFPIFWWMLGLILWFRIDSWTPVLSLILLSWLL